MASLSAALFAWDEGDLQRLRTAKRAELVGDVAMPSAPEMWTPPSPASCWPGTAGVRSDRRTTLRPHIFHFSDIVYKN